VSWILFAGATLFFLSTISEVYQEGRYDLVNTLFGKAFMGEQPLRHDDIPPADKSVKVSAKKIREADRLCDEAQKSEHDRAWSDVQSKLLRALQLDSQHVCSLYNYGRLLDYVWNNPDKAEQMYRRALNADAKHVPSLRNLGYFLYYVRRDYPGASAMWSRALIENPRELDVLSGYASLHYNVYGDLEKAEQLFKEALKVQSGHANTLHNYAKMLHYGRGDAKNSENLYRRILDKLPNHIGALLDYAGLLHEFHHLLGIDEKRAIDKAIDLWERVVQLNPSHLDAIFLLARAEHFVRGKTNKAERLYKKLLAEGHTHLNALANYAMLLRAQGRLKAAEEHYEKLASQNQDIRFASALVAYGDLLAVNKGAHTKAQQMYERALKTQPFKTIQVAMLPGHRCWLCCNSTRAQDLCCTKFKGGQHDEKPDDGSAMWFKAPPPAPRFGP